MDRIERSRASSAFNHLNLCNLWLKNCLGCTPRPDNAAHQGTAHSAVYVAIPWVEGRAIPRTGLLMNPDPTHGGRGSSIVKTLALSPGSPLALQSLQPCDGPGIGGRVGDGLAGFVDEGENGDGRGVIWLDWGRRRGWNWIYDGNRLKWVRWLGGQWVAGEGDLQFIFPAEGGIVGIGEDDAKSEARERGLRAVGEVERQRADVEVAGEVGGVRGGDLTAEVFKAAAACWISASRASNSAGRAAAAACVHGVAGGAVVVVEDCARGVGLRAGILRDERFEFAPGFGGAGGGFRCGPARSREGRVAGVDRPGRGLRRGACAGPSMRDGMLETVVRRVRCSPGARAGLRLSEKATACWKPEVPAAESDALSDAAGGIHAPTKSAEVCGCVDALTTVTSIAGSSGRGVLLGLRGERAGGQYANAGGGRVALARRR